MNRRSFVTKLAGIGLFSILPGAGRLWKAERRLPPFIPTPFHQTLQDFLKTAFDIALGRNGWKSQKEMLEHYKQINTPTI